MQPAQKVIEKSCAHCGLPVPFGKQGESSPLFCCSGCQFVYQTIHSYGLEKFYDLKDQVRSTPVDPSRTAFDYMDDQTFFSRYTKAAGTGKVEVTLSLGGMHCAACVWIVERMPSIVPGVESAVANFTTSTARIIFDPARSRLSKIAAVLDSLGYPPSIYSAQESDAAERRSERDLLIKIGVAAVCASNVMMIAVSLYQGMYTGIESQYADFHRWISLVITLPVVLYSSLPFYRAAWGGMRVRRLHLDLPISLGILTGFAASVYNTLLSHPQVYFDSVSMLVFLLLVGRWFQMRAVKKALQGSRSKPSFIPTRAWVREERELKQIYVGSVKRGDHLTVPAGERVPVDGTVNSGEAVLDLSILTGESRPVHTHRGARVFAGTRNLGSEFDLIADAVADETRLGKILKLIDDGGGKRAQVIAVTDRIGGQFVAAVLLISLITFFYWLPVSFKDAFDNTLALLVITCPCALGLAAPVALTVALARASRKGILIRSSDAVERLAETEQIYLDKTGTLTTGVGKVTRVEWFSAPSDTERRELAVAVAALEQGIEHPIALALREHFSRAIDPSEFGRFSDVIFTPGEGVRGTDDRGEVWKVSSWRSATNLSSLPDRAHESYKKLLEAHLTPVVCMRGEEIFALIGVGDDLRKDAAQMIRALSGSGREIFVLSGDDSSVVSYIGSKLGIPEDHVFGSKSPEEKAAILDCSIGRSAMVGDGVNDAAALAKAYVGVGVRGGAENCLSVADVFIGERTLEQLKETFLGADRTLRIIKLNLAISLGYNIVGAAAAMTGMVNPLFAAILMPLSSLTVVFSSSLAESY